MVEGPKFDLVLIGHVARDRNVVDGVANDEPGGGVYFGSIALAHLGLRVAVVTRLARKDFGILDDMRQEGVQVFVQPASQTSGIENLYNSADMERRVCHPLGFAGPIQPADIPKIDATIYAVTPIIAGEIAFDTLEALVKLGPVALDIQGFVRVPVGNDLAFRPWSQIAEGLAKVAYLKVDRAEAEHLTGAGDLQRAAQRLSEYGPREIILTQSSGVSVLANGKFYHSPFTSRSLVGRTGRGDTCFSTYLGARLSFSPEQACAIAAAVTSLKQEKPGPWRGTRREALAGLEAKSD